LALENVQNESLFIWDVKTIGIELVRGCNFRCVMCPVTAHDKLGIIQHMDLELLEKITSQIEMNPTINTIWLFNFGEPLLHPRLRECLEIVSSSKVARNANVIMHTNASLLKGEKADALLDIPIVKQLVISFDGLGDKQSYEDLRSGQIAGIMVK